jgi:hypothetical protein
MVLSFAAEYSDPVFDKLVAVQLLPQYGALFVVFVFGPGYEDASPTFTFELFFHWGYKTFALKIDALGCLRSLCSH